MTEAQRPVDEDLQLNGGVGGDEFDLIAIQLPGQYHARHAQLGRGVDAGQIVDGHLGAGVQRQIRADSPQHAGRAQVLHQHGVRAAVAEEAARLRDGVQLPVADQRVQRDVDLAAALPAVFYGIEIFPAAEVFRAPAGVEGILQPQIDGVRAVLHGGHHRLRAPRGGKQFQHGLLLGVPPRSAGRNCLNNKLLHKITEYYTIGQGLDSRGICMIYLKRISRPQARTPSPAGGMPPREKQQRKQK